MSSPKIVSELMGNCSRLLRGQAPPKSRRERDRNDNWNKYVADTISEALNVDPLTVDEWIAAFTQAGFVDIQHLAILPEAVARYI